MLPPSLQLCVISALQVSVSQSYVIIPSIRQTIVHSRGQHPCIVDPNTMAKLVTVHGQEQRHVNGYTYTRAPVRASKLADWCANTAATQILYLREEAVLRKILILNQTIAALRPSVGLRFVCHFSITKIKYAVYFLTVTAKGKDQEQCIWA